MLGDAGASKRLSEDLRRQCFQLSRRYQTEVIGVRPTVIPCEYERNLIQPLKMKRSMREFKFLTNTNTDTDLPSLVLVCLFISAPPLNCPSLRERPQRVARLWGYILGSAVSESSPLTCRRRATQLCRRLWEALARLSHGTVVASAFHLQVVNLQRKRD